MTNIYAVAVLLSAISASSFGQKLNDTGMSRCVSATGDVSRDCVGTGQDGEFGRDVSYPNSNDGHVGFHFSKICNSGESQGEGHCLTSAKYGKKPNDWGCTQDNVTGLVWEDKTHDDTERNADKVYTYVQALQHSVALNDAKYCGRTDWRLPKWSELQSIVWYGRQTQGAFGTTAPAIDMQWYPNTNLNERDWS